MIIEILKTDGTVFTMIDVGDGSGEAEFQHATGMYGPDNAASWREYVKPEPTAADKLAELDSTYQPQFVELVRALGVATLSDDNETVAEIKAEYAALKTEYQTAREAVGNG